MGNQNCGYMKSDEIINNFLEKTTLPNKAEIKEIFMSYKYTPQQFMSFHKCIKIDIVKEITKDLREREQLINAIEYYHMDIFDRYFWKKIEWIEDKEYEKICYKIRGKKYNDNSLKEMKDKMGKKRFDYYYILIDLNERKKKK